MGKEKKAKGTVKKPFYKKWWFWVIIIVVLAGIIGSGGGKDEDKGGTPPTTAEPEESQTPAETKTDDVSADKFVEDVKTAIQGAISSKTESIQDVVLKDRDLCVYVDFSNADPSPLTLEDLALSRTSSITDAILELKDYDSLWETITVDFGEVGHITNNKADIQTSGGGRYFPSENFKLQ